MPNWCMNDLRVTGAESEVLKFIEDNKTNGEFCFKTLSPEPEYDDDNEWYDWRISNWGVKWDVDGNVDVQKLDDGSYRLYFTTAWDAPIYWFRDVVGMYPTLKFELASGEPGMNWHYVWQAQGGRSMLESRGSFEDYASFWGVQDMVDAE